MERHTKIGKYPFTDEEVAELREYFGEQIAKEIENAVIETVGDSAATMAQAAAIARGKN